MPTTLSQARREATSAARDALYVSIGLGVIAVQRAQIRRNELERLVDDRLTGMRRLLGAPASGR